MKKLYLSPVLLIAFLSSCSWLDKPEQIPAYIYIDHIDLSTTTAEGSNSAEIIDAWVYVDDNSVGVFELPARIPVLKEGFHKITVYAGVKADGINKRRRRYPFYKPYIIPSFEFRTGMVDTLKGAFQPVVTYYPSNQMTIWIDDFDDPGFRFDQDPTSDTAMAQNIAPAEVFEGNGSGVIYLSATQTYFKANSIAPDFDFPLGGIPVYLEMDYKTNNTLRVGVQITATSNVLNIDNTVIRPSYDENGNLVWKKIYCELTEVVGSNPNAISSKVYLKMIKDDGVTNPMAIIDNVKVLYGN